MSRDLQSSTLGPNSPGRLPKWPTGADCKSAGLRLRWFESITYHHFPVFELRFTIFDWPDFPGSVEFRIQYANQFLLAVDGVLFRGAKVEFSSRRPVEQANHATRKAFRV